MADLIKKIKIKKQDGTFTDYIPIGANAVNVETSDGESVELKLNKKPYYYNTVANMKADTKLKAGNMAITLGYYEANDGGGAKYQIVNNSQLVDDGGSVHNLVNGLKAQLIVNDSVNVKQFGAYGDGEHDDTAAIQNALNNYIDVLIPATANSYLITSSLKLTKNGQRLRGNVTFENHGGNFSNLIGSVLKFLEQFEDEEMISVSYNLKKCEILNLNLCGDINLDSEVDGINLSKNSRLDTPDYGFHIMRNVTIQNMSGNGLVCTARSVDNYLDNVNVYNCNKSGIIWKATDSTLIKVYTYRNKQHGILIGENSNGGANSFESLKAYMNGSDGDEYYGIYVVGGHNRFVNANSQQNYGVGCVIAGDGNLFSNLVVDGNGYMNSDNELPALFVDGNKNIVNGYISGNWVKGTTKYGLQLGKNAIAENQINLICDDFSRQEGSKEDYYNLPTMDDYILPFVNINNKIIINNRDIFENENIQWTKLVTMTTVDNGNITSAVSGNNLIVTPAVTYNDPVSSYTATSLTSSYSYNKPVLIARAKVKSFKPIVVTCFSNFKINNESKNSAVNKRVDLVTGGKNEYVYLALDLTDYNLTPSNFNYAQLRFKFEKALNLTNKGTNVIIEEPEFYWTSKNENFVDLS